MISLSWVVWVAFAATPSRVLSPEEVIDSYINQIKSGQFKTSGCPRASGPDWVRYLLVGEPITQNYRFSKDCDLQGVVVVKRSAFPVDLAVRHLNDATRLKGTLTPSISPDLMKSQISVEAHFDDGKLFDRNKKAIAHFKADYLWVSGFDGKAKANSGGKVVLLQVRGENLAEPIERPLSVK